jgi:hypothetical protein
MIIAKVAVFLKLKVWRISSSKLRVRGVLLAYDKKPK